MNSTRWEWCLKRLSFAPLLALTAGLVLPTHSLAVVTSSTLHGASDSTFNSLISSADLIQGKQTLDVDVYENPADSFGNPSLPFWHPANTDPADRLAAFTDGAGIRASGLTGLLNDNFVGGQPSDWVAKIVEYPFDSPVDIGKINIFTGNRLNADGRIFSTTYIEYSTDNAFSFQPLGYFQSDPSGTINSETNPQPPLIPPQHSTLVSVFDDTSLTMLSGVTNLIFNFYSVDNTQGEMRDPFNGVNMFTGLDDGLTAADESPLVFEIDVWAPSTILIGDYNGNGIVDAADYTSWRNTLGQSVTPGSGADGSGNGVIDTADYSLWKLYFGSVNNPGSGAVSTVAAPEPSTLGVVVPLLGVLLGARVTRMARFVGRSRAIESISICPAIV
jgi:hypothetical protein